MSATRDTSVSSSDSKGGEPSHESDRALVMSHDPYWESEIELKLDAVGQIEATELLQSVRKSLESGKLFPYDLDPFGFSFRRIRHHVFADVAEGGRCSEAFVLLELGDQLWFREKTKPEEHLDSEGGHPLRNFILDRKESERRLSVETFRDFLGILAEFHERGRRALYVGHFWRHLGCIACRNTASGHRYAIVVDQCDEGPGHVLKQLEIEYIWRREPAIRQFAKAELYAEICELASLLMGQPELGEAGLSPSRVTKFEWLVSLR